jgi:hypothetical protein
MTDRPIIINNLATLLHSMLRVTGDTASLSTNGPSFIIVVLITDSMRAVDVSFVTLKFSNMAI